MKRQQYVDEMNTVTAGDDLRRRLVGILTGEISAEAEKPAGDETLPALPGGQSTGTAWRILRRVLPAAACLALALLVLPYAMGRFSMKRPDSVKEGVAAMDGTAEYSVAGGENGLDTAQGVVYLAPGEEPWNGDARKESVLMGEAPLGGKGDGGLRTAEEAALALARGEYVTAAPALPRDTAAAGWVLTALPAPESAGDGKMNMAASGGEPALYYRFYVPLPDLDREGLAAYGLYDVPARE